MRWDAKQRRYETDSGRPLTPAQVRAHIEDFITSEQSEVNAQAEKLLVGAITSAAFFAFMRHKVTAWHGIAGTIAYGGQDQMNAERWKRINEKIVSELQYLADFEAQTEQSFAAADAIAETVARMVEVAA